VSCLLVKQQKIIGSQKLYNMTFFRKTKAGSCPGVDSSIPSNKGGKKNLDLRHRSESTFVMGEEWDSGETIGDDNSSPRSVGYGDGDLEEEFQNMNTNQDEKMTQVLEGTSLSIPSIPPSFLLPLCLLDRPPLTHKKS